MITSADPTCCLTTETSRNGRPVVCAIINSRKEIDVTLQDEACEGASIRQLVWQEMDAIMERLMTPGAEAEDGRDPGRAEGCAMALAIMTNPYTPNLDDIRSAAVERYETHQGYQANKESLCSKFGHQAFASRPHVCTCCGATLRKEDTVRII